MDPTDETTQVTDGRLLRGRRTRRTVLRAAVDAASLDGLDGVTFGRMSSATGHSKAGIQTLFRTKEALQLATAELAGELFARSVVEPTSEVPAGVARLDALVERWLDYASAPLFAGGCFWSATAAEYDSRPGPVRDLLLRQRRTWRQVLEREVRAAVESGEVQEQDPSLAAFQIDAVLNATNVDLRFGDDTGVARARLAVERILRP